MSSPVCREDGVFGWLHVPRARSLALIHAIACVDSCSSTHFCEPFLNRAVGDGGLVFGEFLRLYAEEPWQVLFPGARHAEPV